MKRVAIYTRVSPKPKARAEGSESIEDQKQALEAFCKARGWTQVEHYTDVLKSGTTLDRPQLQRLLGDARKRKIDVIVFFKLDRFFRNLKDIVTTANELEELGVEFISFKENLDVTTSSGKLLFHVISAFAEFESDIIRERARDAIAARQARGVKWGRPRKIDRAKVLSLHNSGLTQYQIAKKLKTSRTTIYRIVNGKGDE